jgi:class 3 adenylate cyclase/tetratricopeptide (TPR) repeat protein
MKFCGACGAPLPGTSAGDPAEDGSGPVHRRHLTVMFCDLVGSTPLAETLDPEDFRDVLAGYRHACTAAIQEFGGYVAQWAGDGLLAYFGYPRAQEDSPQRAVHAGLGILAGLGPLNQQLSGQHGIALRVRIGIHTGLVVAGEMGAGTTREPLAIVGEAPHIASRLQSIAAPASIVISDATRDLVEGFFVLEGLGAQPLKGVSRPIGVHRVIRPTGAVARLEVAGERRLTPLVGRDHELARLAQAWQQARRGHGAVVHLRGEAGIGKSRIVRELLDRLGPHVGNAQTWQCSGHHRGTALHPVIRYLERLLALDRSQAPDDQLAAVSHAVIEAGLDPIESVPLLVDLLAIEGAPDGDRPPLAPRDVRTATLHVLEAFLFADPTRQPLLLVVEDLHWADPTTIELLGRIVADLSGMPVLCILTFRPEFAPPWARSPAVAEVALGPLSSENVRALAAWATLEPLAPAVLDWVDQTADGIPLFVEETLKMLEHASGGDSGGAVESLSAVPSTLRGLLTERLDRLPALGEVVDVAAVLGREFDRELLAALWPADAPDPVPALTQLAVQDVLRPVDGQPSRCEFSHALLQEAAYDRILHRRRQVLHGEVAAVLTRRFPAVADREPEVVARHLVRAAQHAEARRYWHTAGLRALERAAFLEAAEHFRRGLEAVDAAGVGPDGDDERIHLLTWRGASLQAAHGYAVAGAKEAYVRARQLGARTSASDHVVSITRGEWAFYLLRAEYGQALALGTEMLALAQAKGDPAHLAEGHLYRGMAQLYLGDFLSARTHLEQATVHARPAQELRHHVHEAQSDREVAARAYLTVALWNLGWAEQSRACSDASLELAGAVGGPLTRAQCWGMRAIYHLTRAEPVEMRHWVEKTRAHSADVNIAYWRILSEMLGAWQWGRGGDLRPAIAALEEGLDAYLASGSRLALPHFYILLADLRRAAGRAALALDALKAGHEHVAATGEGFSESELYRFTGRTLMAGDAPDPAAATVAFERAIAAAHAREARLLELRAATQLAVHQGRIGDTVTALERVATLCEWFGPTSEVADVVRARKLLAVEPTVL